MFETNISTWFDSSFELNSWMPLENIPIQCLIMLIKWSAKKEISFIDFRWNISLSGAAVMSPKLWKKKRKRIDFTFWFDFYVDATVCPVINVLSYGLFSSSYSQRPFEYLSLNLINLILAVCISSISSYWMAMSNWFPNESAFRKKNSPKTKERKREKIEDIEFRIFESHTKININFQSRCVFFNGSGCFCCSECKSHFQFTNKLN